jgi:nucleoside-diphosphate-sugar epimerase
MKVLITGHKGQIGSVLAQKIKHVGIDLIDGQNLLTCELPKNIDIVFHLAAQSSVEPSWYDPLHDLDNI